MVELKLIDSGEEANHVHKDIELLYVLKGQLRVFINEKSYDLSQSDVIAVNANTQHGFRMPEQSIICRVCLEYNAFLESVQKNYAIIWCNSAAAGSAAYRELTEILDEMIDIWLVSKKSRYIRQSITYRLIGCLADNFMLSADGTEVQNGDSSARKDAMLRYIGANYFREISLQEMAEYFYMTQSAVSKYFKKTVGTNFIEYLNQIRLHYAVQDLLFSDKSITHIAMDNGFSSPSAFNKHFRTVYNMTPTHFRDSMKMELDADEQVSGDDNELARWYLAEKQKSQGKVDEEHWISADVLHGSPRNSEWTEAVNLGTAGMLLSETVRKQVLNARKRLPFRYGRIRGMFAEDMHCLRMGDPGQMSFDLQDDVLGFMKEHTIIPIIVLDPGDRPKDPACAVRMVRNWLKHAAARFGRDSMSRWVFEVPADAQILEAVREVIPVSRAGFYYPSAEQALEFAGKIGRQDAAVAARPDFITIDVSMPRQSAAQDMADRIMPDHRDLLSNAAEKLYEVCSDISMPLCFSQWNLSIAENSAYNDSCQKAALMLVNMTRAYGKVQLGIYSCLTDLENSYNESAGSGFGGSGLLHKDGIPKPAFHALSFVSRLLPVMICRQDGCIITTDQRGRYSILCFNAKDVGQEYYLRKAEKITAEDLKHISVDEDPQTFHITLNNIPNGACHIKKLVLSPDEGSIMLEWNTREPDDPDSVEKECIRSVNMPVVTVTNREIKNQTLVMHETLKAHEICLFELY